MSGRNRIVGLLGTALLSLSAVSLSPVTPAQDARADWVEVDYGALVDRRQPSHSGAPVGVLLERLGGRPAPAAGERPADRLAHSLLDPLVEPYGFVMADAVDALAPSGPWIEVSRLWAAGERQPAWVELLRARRLIVESDGAGSLRAFLPLPGTGTSADERAATAVERAWAANWPVLRLVLAAEHRRLTAGAGTAGERSLSVSVHAFRHRLEDSIFQVTRSPFMRAVDDFRSDGLRPPLDLTALGEFLDSGLWIEGARLDEDGSLTLLGSRAKRPATMLGGPLQPADLAVAYRAVFHGGLAEPYMSLDRGFSPQTSIVNYGGRLRDTRLGMVSLLCDIRFKTFSLGLDIVTGADVRDAVRADVRGFRTHLERFAHDPDASDVSGQQTRMWFYPDRVDLTVSAQGDLLAMRKVRMSASSERVTDMAGGAAAGGADPPWTRATVDAINEDYDALAEFFPELADLDQAVRLLSLFTWLKQAVTDGLPVPELDVLLDLPLPELYTPRTFPQLLAFNALPAPGGGKAVDVFDRVPVAEALDRVGPVGTRPLPALRRLRRALAALDSGEPRNAQLLAEAAAADPAQLSETEQDLLAYRAERLRMHQTVLGTLPAAALRKLAGRQEAGEQLRVFSVGIGGLDLGMGQALDRARGRRIGLAGGGTALAAATATVAGSTAAVDAPQAAWRLPPPGLAGDVPAHGWQQGAAAFGDHRVRIDKLPAGGDVLWTVLGQSSAEVAVRRLERDGSGRAVAIERFDLGVPLRFEFAGDGGALRAEVLANTGAPAAVEVAAPPPGLALIRLQPEPFAGEETPTLLLELRGGERLLEASFPRPALQRLVLGAEVDAMPGQPLPGLSELPPQLGEIETAMVLLEPDPAAPPWERRRILAGEEHGAIVAAALAAFWGAGARAVAVGVDPAGSPGRWAAAPAVGRRATLVLPAGGFTGSGGGLDVRLAAAWKAGPVVDDLPASPETPLLVVVSAEPPALLAARLRDWAGRPALRGRLVAVWSLAGPLRTDLPARLLEQGPAAVGIASSELVELRRVESRLDELQRKLTDSGAARVEQLGGPFLWYF